MSEAVYPKVKDAAAASFDGGMFVLLQRHI